MPAQLASPPPPTHPPPATESQNKNTPKYVSAPETHTKRQATQHGCLPSMLSDGAKELKQCTVRKIIFCTGPTRAAKAEEKSLVYWLDKHWP